MPPLRLLGEEIDGLVPAAHHWACADLVHLRFHQERLILADGTTLGVNTEEAPSSPPRSTRTLPTSGTFHAATAERWYLRVGDRRRLPDTAALGHGRPPHRTDAAGGSRHRPAAQAAQRSADAAAQPRRQRSTRRRRPVDHQQPVAVGSGAVAAGLHTDFSSVWADHPLPPGWRCAGAASPRHAGLVRRTGRRAAGRTPAGRHRHLLGASKTRTPTPGAPARRRWKPTGSPLLAAIRAGDLTLDLRASTRYGMLSWQVKRGDLWRFWQRPQTLAALAQHLPTPATRSMTRILPREIPCRSWQLEQQGLHLLLARIYAARGVESADELNYDLKSLIPPARLTHAADAAVLLADAIEAEGPHPHRCRL